MAYKTASLADIPLFEGLSEIQILDIMPCLGAKIREYDKNAIIFLEGEKAEKFGVVLSGSVRIIKEDYAGNRSILGVITKGNLFAEEYAGSKETNIPVSVVASERSSVMLVDSDRIFSSCIGSCDMHRIIIKNILQIVSGKNIMLNRKIEFMSKRTTKEKLMAYLYSEAEKSGSDSFSIPFDRQSLADFLGVERSAMSAEIGKLRDAGIIEVDRSNFRILSKNYLL